MGGEVFGARPTRGHMPTRFLLVMLALLVWPSPAAAGTYDVYSCRLPVGTSIPANGWRPFAALGGETAGSCADGGTLKAGVGLTSDSPGAEAGWVFDAPADTAIESFAVQRWAYVDSNP